MDFDIDRNRQPAKGRMGNGIDKKGYQCGINTNQCISKIQCIRIWHTTHRRQGHQ